jgi:hypothetical protein
MEISAIRGFDLAPATWSDRNGIASDRKRSDEAAPGDPRSSARRILSEQKITVVGPAEKGVEREVPVHAKLIRDASDPIPIRIPENIRARQRRGSVLTTVHGFPEELPGDDRILNCNARMSRDGNASTLTIIHHGVISNRAPDDGHI